tara:strand:+ start:1989 stop:2324 length:336 start_codon:yes stop_codon:yes gene_type:complete
MKCLKDINPRTTRLGIIVVTTIISTVISILTIEAIVNATQNPQPEKPKSIDITDLSSRSSNKVEYKIIIINNCEYIVFNARKRLAVTHSGTCNNHARHYEVKNKENDAIED